MQQDYHPDDVKGKGEPAFSIERRLKDRNNGQDPVDDTTYIELVERPKRMSHDFGASGSRTGSPILTGSPTTVPSTGETSGSQVPGQERYGEWEQGRKASRSGSKRLSVDLKRRIGSLRRKEKHVDDE